MKYMKSFLEEKPRSGKFVAFFDDGSGCVLFRFNDDGSVNDCKDVNWADPEFTVDSLLDKYSHWMPIDDDFEFWCDKND